MTINPKEKTLTDLGPVSVTGVEQSSRWDSLEENVLLFENIFNIQSIFSL